LVTLVTQLLQNYDKQHFMVAMKKISRLEAFYVGQL